MRYYGDLKEPWHTQPLRFWKDHGAARTPNLYCSIQKVEDCVYSEITRAQAIGTWGEKIVRQHEEPAYRFEYGTARQFTCPPKEEFAV